MTQQQRFFFDVAYDGTAYHGWQFQPGQATVQGTIEAAMRKFADDFEGIAASGRTDTGVHCIRQVFHADLSLVFEAESLQHKLNRMLPHDIAIGKIRRVVPTAHARFDALHRSYTYRIARKKMPFGPKHYYWFERPLSIMKMNQAAEVLLKYENFESFSKVRTEVNHFLCNIIRAEWVEEDSFLIFHVTANRFLRGMVRALVGTMLEIGEGKRTVDDLTEILEALDRRKAGPAAPPEGLYFVDVTYPEEIYLD